uniref:hypothetical protein n=1 Tax=Pararhizobium sp. IMCC3301 TaxID=3067904 RepID=UPI002741B45D|nr:hypothetical protein [Pararhizobium sp. IMCC3301]
MSVDLNIGTGQCQGTTRLLIKPVEAVIELGASVDVMTKALGAVHHANRHAAIDDFIAVALPGMRKGRNCMLPGHEIELIGSEVSLMNLLALDGISSLKKRGMLTETEIFECYSDAGETGAAYVRDNTCAKHTAGWVRRSIERAERRGKPVGQPVKVRDNDLSALKLQIGSGIIHVREVLGVIGEGPIMVSTYGFSSPNSLAILPVMPDSAGVVINAT